MRFVNTKKTWPEMVCYYFIEMKTQKGYSATGNRTPVSRVTGGDTHHYTIVE